MFNEFFGLNAEELNSLFEKWSVSFEPHRVVVTSKTSKGSFTFVGFKNNWAVRAYALKLMKTNTF